MNKVVIVNSGKSTIIKEYGVDALETLRSVSLPIVLLRSILLRISQKSTRWFLKHDWLDSLMPYDTIILFDCLDTITMTQKIDNKYTSKRKILFFWNPILSVDINKIPSSFEVWTSDYGDAKQYGFKYTGQFIYDMYFNNLDFAPKYDVYFVGINKGRFSHLLKMKSNMVNSGLDVFYRLVSPMKSKFSKKYSNPIPYRQVIEESARSVMMLEYNQQGQKGMTLRSVESLMLQKKLITNNPDIRKMDFYTPNNIFIFSNDDITGIEQFLNKPFVPYNKETVTRYYFSSWLERIINGEELVDR